MKIKHSMKKALSVVLAVIMVVSAMPVALAADKPCDHPELEITIPAKKPGCETYGYTAQRECKSCTYVEKAEYIPATGHDYKMVDGSQNSRGVTYRCDGCMDSYIVPHHSWSYTLIAKAPSCTENGWTADRVCNDCGYREYSETLPATDHDYEVISSDNTMHTIRCKNCGYTMENDGHLYTIVFDGSFDCYSENATGKKVCSKCGYVAQSDISIAAGTHPNMTVSSKNEYTLHLCNDCGFERIVVNNTNKCSACKDRLDQSEYSVMQPSCAAPGYVMYKCGSCSHSDTLAVAAMGHYMPGEYVTVVNPTCQDFGKQSKFCLRCDHTDDIVLAKIAHNTIALTESYDATCTEDGITPQTYCLLCGMFEMPVVIPATGHNLIDYNGVPFCTNCYKYMIDTETETVACKCLCHNGDGFAKTIFNFIIKILKIFGIMQSCDCGAVHYEKNVK